MGVLLLATACVAQNKPLQEPQSYPGQSQPNREEDAWEVQQRKAMANKANLQRQRDIQKDTEKLLELATELKQAVDKSNADTLSLDVVKKAEQIEKLAKTVKDKMKGP
jgi:predicted ATPase with chaperone activity